MNGAGNPSFAGPQGIRIPHKAERALMQYIVRCRDVEHMSWRQVCDDVERRYAQADGHKPRPYGFQRFSQYQLQCAYKAEKRIQAEYARELQGGRSYTATSTSALFTTKRDDFRGLGRERWIRHVYSDPCSFFDADGRFLDLTSLG